MKLTPGPLFVIAVLFAAISAFCQITKAASDITILLLMSVGLIIAGFAVLRMFWDEIKDN